MIRLRSVSLEQVQQLRLAAAAEVIKVDDELERMHGAEAKAEYNHVEWLRYTTRLRRDNQPMLEALVLLRWMHDLLEVSLSDALIADRNSAHAGDDAAARRLRETCLHPLILIEEHRDADEQCRHCAPHSAHGECGCAFCGLRQSFGEGSDGMRFAPEGQKRFCRVANGNPLVYRTTPQQSDPHQTLDQWLDACARTTDIDDLFRMLAGSDACLHLEHLLESGLPPATVIAVRK